MAKNHANVQEQAERDLRLTKVAPLMLSGKTQSQIADELAVDQSTISRDIRTLRQRWRKEAALDTQRFVEEQVAVYRVLIQAHLPIALQGKTRSAEVVMQGLAQLSKLLGLDAPAKQEVAFEGDLPAIRIIGIAPEDLP